MCRWQDNFRRTCRYSTLAVALLLCLVNADSPSNHAQERPRQLSNTTKPDQSSPSPGSLENTSHNEIIPKEDVDVYVAFFLIQLAHLPLEAHLGSGFRTKEDQISIIRKFAQGEGISTENVVDLEGWRAIAAQLRRRDYRIADPDRTPHSSTERIVLDIGRADLNLIKAACYRAESQGWIEIINLIHESKAQQRAIHVELNIRAAGMYAFGFRGSLLKKTSSSSSSDLDAAQSNQLSSSENDERRKIVMQELASRHESAADPRDKIKFDNDMIALMNPDDRANIQILKNEIKEHEEELKRNETEKDKQRLIDAVTDAQDRGCDEAEKAAIRLRDAFPNTQKTLDNITVRCLVDEAINQLVKSDCSNCKTAERIIGEALKVSSIDPRALRIQSEIQVCLNECRSRFIGMIVLIVLVVGGIGVALFFWLRPKRWMLVGIEGPCKGEVFPLDKPETVIGALDSSEEEGMAADIVISDPHHRISRFHCLIRQIGRHLYLRDTSSNGTWINHMRLEPERDEKLFHGAEISLADEAMLVLKVDRSKRTSN